MPAPTRHLIFLRPLDSPHASRHPVCDTMPPLTSSARSHYLPTCTPHSLAKLPARKQMQVAKIMRFVEYEQGDEICRQGEKGDLFYIIVTGRVNVCVCKEDVSGAVLHNDKPETTFPLNAGCSFGEVALVADDSRRSASIIAARLTQCLTVDRTNYLAILFDVTEQENKAKAWSLMLSAMVQKYYEGDSVLPAKYWHRRMVPRNSVIVSGACDTTEGAEADARCSWYLVSGSAEVVTIGADRFAPRSLAQLGPTQFFGLNVPPSCAVVASSGALRVPSSFVLVLLAYKYLRASI